MIFFVYLGASAASGGGLRVRCVTANSKVGVELLSSIIIVPATPDVVIISAWVEMSVSNSSSTPFLKQ